MSVNDEMWAKGKLKNRNNIQIIPIFHVHFVFKVKQIEFMTFLTKRYIEIV